VRREEGGDLAPRDGIADGHAPVDAQVGNEVLELGAMSAFLVGEGGAVHVQLDVVTGEGYRCHRDVEALRSRVAPEGE
jgi:hypothetical protein